MHSLTLESGELDKTRISYTDLSLALPWCGGSSVCWIYGASKPLLGQIKLRNITIHYIIQIEMKG